MEATGAYHEAVATFLFDKGHRVCVVNPQRVKSFGLSEGIRTKNDQVDARLLARFGKAIQPRAWQPEPLPIRESGSCVLWGDAGTSFWPCAARNATGPDSIRIQ